MNKETNRDLCHCLISSPCFLSQLACNHEIYCNCNHNPCIQKGISVYRCFMDKWIGSIISEITLWTPIWWRLKRKTEEVWSFLNNCPACWLALLFEPQTDPCWASTEFNRRCVFVKWSQDSALQTQQLVNVYWNTTSALFLTSLPSSAVWSFLGNP